METPGPRKKGLFMSALANFQSAGQLGERVDHIRRCANACQALCPRPSSLFMVSILLLVFVVAAAVTSQLKPVLGKREAKYIN